MSPEAAACPAADRLHVFSNKEVGGLIISLAVVNVLGIVAALWLLCELPNYLGSLGPLVSFVGAGLAVLADVGIAALAWSITRSARSPLSTPAVRASGSFDRSDEPAPTAALRSSVPRDPARAWAASSTAGSAM